LDYPSGRLWTCVRSIFSFEPPSEANPACISTAIASTTCRSLSTELSHPSSTSLNTLTTRFHFPLLLILPPTTTAATAHATVANPTATPNTTLPIPPDQIKPNYIPPNAAVSTRTSSACPRPNRRKPTQAPQLIALRSGDRTPATVTGKVGNEWVEKEREKRDAAASQHYLSNWNEHMWRVKWQICPLYLLKFRISPYKRFFPALTSATACVFHTPFFFFLNNHHYKNNQAIFSLKRQKNLNYSFNMILMTL